MSPKDKDKEKPKRKHHKSPKSTHQAKDKRRPPHIHAPCSASKKKKASSSSSVLASFRQKLQGSKFRWLNEQLYTQTSDSSCALIEQNPQYFEQYHVGYREVGIDREPGQALRSSLFALRSPVLFTPPTVLAARVKEPVLVGCMGSEGRFPPPASLTRPPPIPHPPSQQTKSWPVRPVDRAIRWLKSTPGARVIADLGCGDAQISRTRSLADRTTHNFDLCQNEHGNVTVCNIADIPLPDASVDACVFCLSLMGTDYGTFLEEAARILRTGGHLWIAEVTSRAVQQAFNVVPDLVAAIEALGFTCTSPSKKVAEGSYFFELVFVKRGERKATDDGRAVAFPKLRACAYKKR